MDPIVGLAVGLALLVGAALAWLARRGEVARLVQALAAERARTDETLRALDAERAAHAEARARLDGAERAHAEKVAALTALRGDIEKDLKVLAEEALKRSQTSFLGLANEVFDKHRKLAAGELEQRKDAIQGLIAPMQTALAEYRQGLQAIEQHRKEAYGSLTNELKNVAAVQERVRSETSKLVNALRAAPKTRGRWGEETLKNVLELAGMTPYCDFVAERSIGVEDGRLRPDVVIRLPGERYIVVDAKTSMAAYMDAIEAHDEETREAHLERHARQLRTHMRQLSSKSYQDALDVTPDFVAMFVPGDNFFAAAMERDPQLFEDAVAQRVLIVTPTTLIALAKAVAFGWRQEKVADNARRIAELGRELYRRLATMGEHVSGVGRDLERTVKRYNAFVGSLESSVMPQARRFVDLEVEGADKPLAEAGYVETETRLPRTDRDLITGEDPAPERPEPEALSPAAE